ncbi:MULTISPECIES: hypothetical protein [unclassified Aeromicrobium]|uniref:hypothetical protein n=1 Tax=unclassified Aeromicrobium TaxID=2633570 RepID=UPI00396B438D
MAALYAATSPDAVGGRFYGPGGLGNLAGEPAEQKLYKPLEDLDDSKRVWALSEQMSGVEVTG